MEKLFIILFLLFSANAYGITYIATVTRLDADVYQTTTGYLISSRNCLVYAYKDSVMLVVDSQNKGELVFDDGTKCEFLGIFKERQIY